MTNAVVFGLQRSGTNFAEVILKENFKTLNIVNTDNRYVWKHAYDWDLTKHNPTNVHILLTKSPYSWIESIIRKKVDLFKRRPHIKADENSQYVIGEIDLEKLAQLWSDYIKWWHKEEIIQLVRYERFKYEDLIDQPINLYLFLEKIRKRYDLINKYTSKEITHPTKVSQSGEWNDTFRDRYVNEKIETLTWEQVEVINNIIPSELFHLTGYKKIDEGLYNKRKQL